MEPVSQPLCAYCQSPLGVGFAFCPNCGKKIRESAITIGEQIGLYALSLFLAPFGLIPGIKNVMQKEPSRKRAGVVAIVLTIISIGFTFWIAQAFFSQLNSAVNSPIYDLAL